MRKSNTILGYILSFIFVSTLGLYDYELEHVMNLWFNGSHLITILLAAGVLTLFGLLFIQTLDLTRGKNLRKSSRIASED